MEFNWQEVSVDDLKAKQPSSLSTGPFGSSISAKFFQDSGIPVIRGSNLSEDISTRLIDDNLVFISPDKAKEFERCKVYPGDLIFTCWGTIGQVGLIDHRAKFDTYVISNKQMKLTPDKTKADSLFLYYLFSSPQILDTIKSQAIGSSVPGFNLGQLKSIRLVLPLLKEQAAIASVLSALDDKIELNRQTNKGLETIAETIFRSWFVDFEPVHAKIMGKQPEGLEPSIAKLFPDELIKSELGDIPRDWQAGRLSDGFNITMGQSPPGETYNEIGDGLAFFQGRRDFGFRYPSRRVFCMAPTRIAEAGDTLVSVRAPVGDVNMAAEKSCIGRGVAAVRHKSGSRSFSYYSMLNLKTFFACFESEGTVFGAISKPDFLKLPYVMPPDSLISAFEEIAYPFEQRIEQNTVQNTILVELRDTLLPKLITGELRVKDAEVLAEGCI